MKKFIVCAIIALSCVGAFAAQKSQNDTVLVRSASIKFDVEFYESKTGKTHIDYLCLIDGEWYHTNKTSYDRYNTCKKFGGKPNVFWVKPKDTKVKTLPKVIVL